MKFRTGNILCIILSIYSAALGVGNQANSNRKIPPEKTLVISSEAREVISRPWKEDSFEKGMRLIVDPEQSVDSRRLLMSKLSSRRRQMNTAERSKFRDNALRISKDSAESPKLRGMAIREMASTSLAMWEAGEISKEQAMSENQFLIKTIKDQRAGISQRSASLNAIKTLNITEARKTIENLLSDPKETVEPEIAKSGCLALIHIAGSESFNSIHRVHNETNDPSVFSTSAYCLRQIKSPKAVAALVKNDKRFPDAGTATFNLVNMEDVICDTLLKPDEPDLAYAIEATKHLWRPGQKKRYTPLLYDLLKEGDRKIREVVAVRLIDNAKEMSFDEEQAELAKILNVIKEQSDLADYADRVKQKLSAKKLTPVTTNVPVVID